MQHIYGRITDILFHGINKDVGRKSEGSPRIWFCE